MAALMVQLCAVLCSSPPRLALLFALENAASLEWVRPQHLLNELQMIKRQDGFRWSDGPVSHIPDASAACLCMYAKQASKQAHGQQWPNLLYAMCACQVDYNSSSLLMICHSTLTCSSIYLMHKA